MQNCVNILLQYPMTILYDPSCKKEPSTGVATQYGQEKEICMKLFERWSEPEQVHFVEQLLARMCHYQHGHINAYLKPMLQRDFISLLPSKFLSFVSDILYFLTIFITVFRLTILNIL